MRPQCHRCGSNRDSTQHALKDSSASNPVRRDRAKPVTTALIAAMLTSSEGWEAAVSSCEDVMVQKEPAGDDEGDTVEAANSPIVT